ncbi:F-box/kelch-repeat protein [Capsicum chinense]|nr:F-box/kelch-repeat protein [Capsicum chinense]
MWSTRMLKNAPSCLFGKASLGELAIFSGGCDSQGKILSSAELYNSETGTWRTLRSMNKQPKMCSGVFIVGMFYAIGFIGGADSKLLTCAEYDLARETWSEISNMSPVRPNLRNDIPATSAASPVVAVVSNQLYTADYAEMSVRKYEKHNKA